MVDTLPEPVLLRVFSHLTVTELCRVARVSKQWHRVAFDASLWRETDLSGKTLCGNVFLLFIDQISAAVSTMNLKGCSVPLNVICEIFKKCTRLRYLRLVKSDIIAARVLVRNNDWFIILKSQSNYANWLAQSNVINSKLTIFSTLNRIYFLFFLTKRLLEK